MQQINNAVSMLFQLEKDQDIHAKAKQVARLFLLVRHNSALERVFRHWVEFTLTTRLENPHAFNQAKSLEEMAVMLEECVDSWVKQWKHEGVQEGMLQGMQKGKLEGKLEGEALVLKRQLSKRFGQLPNWVEIRLEQASSHELEYWAEVILDAKTLESVFTAH